MTAGVYDITIEQGATFRLSLVWKDSGGSPINLTGYTARMQVRRTYNDDVILLDLTSAAGEIVLGGALGTIEVTGTATDTALMPRGVAVYDLELVNGTVVTRLIQGNADITPEVTR